MPPSILQGDTAKPGGGWELKGHFLDGVYYPAGVQSEREMPILLQISADASGTWSENKKVTLNLASESVVEVFLPEIVFPGEWKFWVGEDGSTWRAFLAPDEGYRVDQSALYAIQHDPGGLAKAAYSARVARPEDYANPESPAVDAGSDDAYGYDSTSTNPKVIDMGQPDIGYKYYRRVADDDPEETQQITLSLKQPELNTDVKFDGFGYYVFEGEGDTPVGDLGYNFAGGVVTKEIEDEGRILRPRGRYNLRVESYYWIDNGDEVLIFDELYLSPAREIPLVVDRDPPLVE